VANNIEAMTKPETKAGRWHRVGKMNLHVIAETPTVAGCPRLLRKLHATGLTVQ
jgi:hypothetical protein